MSPLLSMRLMAFVLQGAVPPGGAPAACPELKRVELSQPSLPAEHEICISPGILTGFVFDLPVQVEVQEELRFMSVLRGRNEIALRPPWDMVEGERLRLTARLGGGLTPQDVTFFLVSRSGQATHQVDVYHDLRPRESILQETAEERAKNKYLHEANQQLLAEIERLKSSLHQFVGLTGAYLSAALEREGIRSRQLPSIPRASAIFVLDALSYCSNTRLAVQVMLRNDSTEEWTASEASLLDAKGHNMEMMILSQAHTLKPHESGTVFLEAAVRPQEFQGTYTLTLSERGARVVTVPQVTFPR